MKSIWQTWKYIVQPHSTENGCNDNVEEASLQGHVSHVKATGQTYVLPWSHRTIVCGKRHCCKNTLWARGSTFSAKLLLGNTFPTIRISHETCSCRYGTPEYQSIRISPTCVKPACFRWLIWYVLTCKRQKHAARSAPTQCACATAEKSMLLAAVAHALCECKWNMWYNRQIMHKDFRQTHHGDKQTIRLKTCQLSSNVLTNHGK